MSIGVKVETDTATPWLKDLASRVTPHRVASEVGPRCQRLIQRNFRSLGSNKRGWPTTEFYNRAADATNWQEGFGFVMIGVNQIGIRQRLMGGPITPQNAKMLTIPARAEAYGKRAREFSGLRFKIVLDPETGRMRPALVNMGASATLIAEKKGKRGGFKAIGSEFSEQPLFWLSKGVKQKPDPRVMPSDDAFAAEFDKSVDVLLRNPEAAQ